MSQLENPSRLGRHDHEVFLYGHKIILWGGDSAESRLWRFTNVLDIYNPVTKRWSSHQCTGNPPFVGVTVNAQVVGRYMYAIGMDISFIFRLDLRSYHWEKVEASGVPPLPETVHRSSWVWQDKIYIFGGVFYDPIDFTSHPGLASISFVQAISGDIANNQCVAFNTRTNAWEWSPSTFNGSAPVLLEPCQCIVSGDFMFAFGKPIGEPHETSLRSIQVFHMPTHTWTNSQEFQHNSRIAKGDYTLTVTGENRAIFYGGDAETIQNFGASTVWLLTWTTNKTGIKDLSCSLWSQRTCNVRLMHKAIFSPETSRLYLLGGGNNHSSLYKLLEEKPQSLGCYSILVGPATLLESSLHVALKSGFNATPIELLNLPSNFKESV